MKPKYHQSALQTFMKCGIQYDFRYIQKIRTPSRAALTVGSATDRAANFLNLRKIQGNPATLEEIQAKASDEFDGLIKDTELDADENAGELKDHTISLTRAYAEKVAPLFTPATVQEEFVIELEEFDLGGTMDITDTEDRVRDTKTSLRSKVSSYVVNKAMQPAMYDYAFQAIRGRKAKGFVFDILTKPTKTLGVEYKPTEGVVTDSDHEWLFQSIDRVHQSIKAGIAIPASEQAWWCSEGFCPYYNLCKGRK